MALRGRLGNPHQRQVVILGNPASRGVTLTQALHCIGIALSRGQLKPENRCRVTTGQKEMLADCRLRFAIALIGFSQECAILGGEFQTGKRQYVTYKKRCSPPP